MTQTPRILIVRLTAIGDCIHGIPVLCALRDHYPQAHLAWVVEGRGGDVLEGHPDLDDLIRLPRRWLKSAKTTWNLRRELRQHRFDIAIDLQCLTKSAIAAWLSGAPRRIGRSGETGRELSRWLNNELHDAQGGHVIDFYLDMLRPLGVSVPRVEYRLPETEADARFARDTLAQLGLDDGRFAIVNPGAGWPSKIWPAENYGRLAQHLRAKHHIKTLTVWAGSHEKQMAETIVSDSDHAALLAPDTSIMQLASLCRRARMMIGSDTGPMHLAVAVGTPTISLHGASLADWCGAYGSDNIRLQVEYESGGSRQRRQADNRAMRKISPEMVAEATDQLVSKTRRESTD